MTGILWYETTLFLGATLGAALLWGIFVSAVKRRGAPFPLLALFSAGALWYTGEALRFLVGQAVPGSAAVVYADQVSRFGLSFIPSAFLATVLAFAVEAGVPIAERLRRTLVLLVLVPGLFTFLLGEAYADTLVGVLIFSLYVMLALALSASLCWRLFERYETEVHRRFYRFMAAALTGIAILVGAAYPLGGVGFPYVGPILSFVLFLSPLVPAFILGYFRKEISAGPQRPSV